MILFLRKVTLKMTAACFNALNVQCNFHNKIKYTKQEFKKEINSISQTSQSSSYLPCCLHLQYWSLLDFCCFRPCLVARDVCKQSKNVFIRLIMAGLTDFLGYVLSCQHKKKTFIREVKTCWNTECWINTNKRLKIAFKNLHWQEIG